MILFLTQDLMIASAASSHARDAGHKFKYVANVDRVLHFIQKGNEADAAPEAKVELLLVDLQTPQFTLDAYNQTLADTALPPTFCFAQHVLVDLLRSARESKFDQVLTRGQFNGALPTMIASIGNPS